MLVQSDNATEPERDRAAAVEVHFLHREGELVRRERASHLAQHLADLINIQLQASGRP